MSGICGIINFNHKPVDPDELHRMTEVAAHRGPDGSHHWQDGSVAMAHLALNITPESLSEQQPLVQDGMVLVADARIDNREELLDKLRAKGYLREYHATDADLILAAYRRWGQECPVHLLGDFAFAIWDSARQCLFAARDGMGMRAFYYRLEPTRILFATEVKQILAFLDVPAHIFEPMVGAYLAGQFSPLTWTFYDGITQLAPAHALRIDASGHRSWRYWDIDPDFHIEYADEIDYADHFSDIFKQAVRCRLRSVKPVGIMLSGGMDSGSIAATAGWHLQRNGWIAPPEFRTYCWAFEQLKQCDERHISDVIVRHYHFPVTYVPADDAWPLQDYPAHAPDRDEPFIGTYQALIENTLEVGRRQGMGLMLSGDRGDLMMGGWILDYLQLFRARQWRTLWQELRTHFHATGEPAAQVVTSYLLNPLRAALQQRTASHWLTWPVRRIRRQSSLSGSSSTYPEWVRSEFAKEVELDEISRLSEPQPTVTGFARSQRYRLVFTCMHMRGMVWSERTQARFGLGFADPWSDRRIASFVLAVPQQILNRPGEVEKRLVRQAMTQLMPEEVRQTARKIVPTPFYEQALRKNARNTVLDLITDSRASARGYVDEQVLRRHYDAFLRGERLSPGFWSALTLEMWLRQYWS